MTTSEPTLDLPEGVRLQLLPPESARTRNHLPRWDVWLGSARIGRIKQWRVRSSSSTFYDATSFHHESAKLIPLESSTDLNERIEKVVAAWHDPEKFVQRFSWE